MTATTDDDLRLPTSILGQWSHRSCATLMTDRLRLGRSSESTEDQIYCARSDLNTKAIEFLGQTPPLGIHVALFLERLGNEEGSSYRVYGSSRTIDIPELTGLEGISSIPFKQTKLANPCHHQLTVDFDKNKLVAAVKEKYIARDMSTSLAFLNCLQSILTEMYRSGMGVTIHRSYGLEKIQPDISRQVIYWFVGTKYWSFLMRPSIVYKILTDPAVCHILDAVKVGQSGSDLGHMFKKMRNLSINIGYAGNLAWIAIGVPVGCDPLVLEQSTHVIRTRDHKHGEWFGSSVLTRIHDLRMRLGARVISCFTHNNFNAPAEIRKISKVPGILYVGGPKFDTRTKQAIRDAHNLMPPGPVGDDGRKYCFDLLFGRKTGMTTQTGIARNARIVALYSASPWTEFETIRTSTFASADHAERTFHSVMTRHGKHIRGECYSFPFEDSDVHSYLSFVIDNSPSSTHVPVTIREKYIHVNQRKFYELAMVREMIIFNMISLDEVKYLLLENEQPIIALNTHVKM